MGWASYFEDKIKRLDDSIHMTQAAFESNTTPDDLLRKAVLEALADAKALLAQAWQHLELATSPELDTAHQLVDARKTIFNLQDKLTASEQARNRFEHDAAERFAELVDARRKIAELMHEVKKSGNPIEKLMRKNFDVAVDLYTSESRIQQFKPDDA